MLISNQIDASYCYTTVFFQTSHFCDIESSNIKGTLHLKTYLKLYSSDSKNIHHCIGLRLSKVTIRACVFFLVLLMSIYNTFFNSKQGFSVLVLLFYEYLFSETSLHILIILLILRTETIRYNTEKNSYLYFLLAVRIFLQSSISEPQYGRG